MKLERYNHAAIKAHYTQGKHQSECFLYNGNLLEGTNIPAHQLREECVQQKPSNDPERRLGSRLLIPCMETNDDRQPKMFEEIIQKEYQVDRTDCTDAVVISQQDRTKDSEGKQPVLVDLQESMDSWEFGQDYPEIPGQSRKVTQYLMEEDKMTKFEYS